MSKRRIFIFYIVPFLAFLVLAGRLFYLNTAKGRYYRQAAEENRVRIIKIPAPRGIIYDRKGRILARNIPVYKKLKMKNKQSLISGENEKLEIISHFEALKLGAEGKEAEVETMIGREYPYGPALSHVVGYLGEATEQEVRSGKQEVGSQKGKVGIEAQYNSLLRGIDGGQLVEVDTQGRLINKISKKEPKSGQNLNLSIDAKLQKTAYEALENNKGAVVASDPGTGEILALVSSPSFNPNTFESCQTASWRSSCQAEIEKILNDPNQPLFNRAISGLYPPGSTFKIVTAIAGLEENKIDQDFEIDDPGAILIGPYRYANWYFTQYGRKEGLVNTVKAIQRSTDTFFYKVGEMIGVDVLFAWANKFGLGKVLGIDLPGEAAGLIPNPEWKEKVKDEPWFLGNTYHLSIGQGDILTTPLQVNVWTAVIANRGRLCQPHLIKNSKSEIRNPKFEIRNKFQIPNNTCKNLNLKPETLALIQEGMTKACAPGGTGWPLFNFDPPVACKTGTAEYGDPEDKTHAWITVYAPADNPEIVLTVLVEGGGEGSSVAGPIAKKVLEEWFGQ